MQKKYRSAADVFNSDILSRLTPPKPHGLERILKSTRLEDAIYNDLRLTSDDTLCETEEEAMKRLSTFKGLSRDAFQAMYALNPRRNDEDELSTIARKFNTYILDDMMNGETYPALKAICEGRELPAYEAAKEFVENIADRLDELLQAAGGEKKSLDVLEKLEAQQEKNLRDLKEMAEQCQRGSQDNSAFDQKLTELANKAESKAKQIAALNRMTDDSLRQNKAAIQSAIQTAAEAAREKAKEVSEILLSWGDDAGNPMGRSAMNQEVLRKVRGNRNLLEIAKHLGRFREILSSLRKNSCAYGRGEKYALEQGNNLQRVITSEFAMLASPATALLFLQKYQRKALKQYQRREAVSKGYGDIIVCLDESQSTQGEAAAWGKALAFSLLEAAKINRRNFALIHFSGKGSAKTDLFPGGKYSMDAVMASADTFLGGGTDYETPLTEALRLIRGGFQNADVVFITDGECAVSEQFAEGFKKAKSELGFTVTGLLLDTESSGFAFSLEPFCERVYRTSEIAGDGIVCDLLVGKV